jgi:Bacterial TSP3 repeat
MPDPDPAAAKPPVQNFQKARRHVGDGPDTDNDGLSDDFETRIFGSDPNQADKDGDGLNDWAEYWVDTDPNNADTDGDQWTDGEDLSFGDPLRADPGGAERAKFLADARKQFDAEGSDRDKDFARDHLEKEFGSDPSKADSDNDGLGDMIELQLKTSPTSPADDTSDLDTARRRLGERRWAAEEAERQKSSSVDSAESGESYAAADMSNDMATFVESAVEQPAYEQPAAYEEPAVYEEPVVADADTDAGAADGSMDAWA